MRTKNEYPKLIDATVNEELFRRKLLEKSFFTGLIKLNNREYDGVTELYENH